jgi:hypothetical protein
MRRRAWLFRLISSGGALCSYPFLHFHEFMTFFLSHGYVSPHFTPDLDDITFSKRGCCVESGEIVRGDLSYRPIKITLQNVCLRLPMVFIQTPRSMALKPLGNLNTLFHSL